MTARPASAQLLQRYYPADIPGYETWFSQTVAERVAEDYVAPGVRAGSFVIRPEIAEAVGYDSNVLGVNKGPGSFVSETTGSVGAASDWGRDQLSASLSFTHNDYPDLPQASFTDWTAAIGGYLDIGRDRLSLAYTHINATGLPSDLGNVGIGQPVSFVVDDARVSYQAEFGRLTIVPAIEGQMFRYDNSTFQGVALDEQTNNRDLLTFSVTAGYSLAPGRSLVFVASDTLATYRSQPIGRAGQDYDDYAVLAGIDFRTEGPFQYRALVGYETRSYVSSAVASQSAPTAELDVIYAPTLLTTVTARVTNSLQSALNTSVTGYTSTDARVQVDHELYRNVRLTGSVEYYRAEFQGNFGTESDWRVGASASYLLNRNVTLEGRYEFSNRDTSFNPAFSGSRHLALLQLAFHL